MPAIISLWPLIFAIAAFAHFHYFRHAARFSPPLSFRHYYAAIFIDARFHIADASPDDDCGDDAFAEPCRQLSLRCMLFAIFAAFAAAAAFLPPLRLLFSPLIRHCFHFR
jgi:hypothetical protein